MIMNTEDEPLILRNEFPHPVQHVFNAFASADAIGQWFAPHESIKTNVTEFNFTEGGEYRMEFTLPDGITTSLSGTFQTINSPAHIVFSFCWEKPDPHADINTIVTIDLIEKGEYTEIIISHIKFKDDEMRKRHTDGWQGTLSRLGEYLEKTKIKEQR